MIECKYENEVKTINKTEKEQEIREITNIG